MEAWLDGDILRPELRMIVVTRRPHVLSHLDYGGGSFLAK